MIIAKYLPELRKHRKSGLAIAAGLLALCFALRYFTPLRLTYVTFYPAIMLGTFVAGRWVGLAITAISALLAVYFFISTAGSFDLSAADYWGLGAFLLVSALIVLVTGWLSTAVTRLAEQSQRRLIAENKIRVLMNELSHRMKNQYAVILAMARATEKSTNTAPEFLNTFSQRLHALARSHDILVKSNWAGASLHELISTVLEPFASGDGYLSDGPAIEINDRAVINLGMALHELATNSAKHGAWSAGRGRVSIAWNERGGRFHFKWNESDGPAVGEVGRTGFGRTVLEEVVPQALGGSAEFKLEPSGLHWTLSAPSTAILAAAAPGNPIAAMESPLASVAGQS